MLHAILKGKIRGLFNNIQEEVPWRQAYSSYEDFLTASVIGRMIYFPADFFLKIINSSSIYKNHQIFYAGNLEYYEFWPNLLIDEESTNMVLRRQPDVLLKFENVDILIEAKRNDDFLQNYNQWSDQLLFYLKNKENNEVDESNPILFWALGGIGSAHTGEQWQSVFDKIKLDISRSYPQENIGFAVSSWKNILQCLIRMKNSLIDFKKNKDSLSHVFDNTNYLRIIDDIIEGLRLHGIRELHFLSEVNKYCKDLNFDDEYSFKMK